MRFFVLSIFFFLTVGLGKVIGQSIYDAVIAGDVTKTQQIIEKDTSVLTTRNQSGWTILHYCSMWIDTNQLEIVQLLVEKGADINAQNGEAGRTPLHLALRDRNEVLAKWLINKGAQVDIRDNNGSLALSEALQISSKEVVDLILDKGVDIDAKTEGVDLMHQAAQAGHERLANQLISDGVDTKSESSLGKNLVHSAAAGGLVNLIKRLAGMDISLDETDLYGQRPLHLGVKRGHFEVVEFLISEGVDINSKTPMGKTALHLAQEKNETQISNLLIQHGADQSVWQFPKLSSPYLSQDSPGNEPKVFAPGIISTEEAHEFAISFHPNGEELVLSRRVYGASNHLISMKFGRDGWTAPAQPDFASTFPEAEGIFSPNGQHLIFHSRRPKTGSSQSARDTWIIDYSTDNPKPELLPEPFESPQFLMYVSSTMDDKIYFTSDGGIYSATKSATGYEEAAILKGAINTPTNGVHPFVAPDESYLIFDASGRSDSRGESDLYISFKKEDGSWSRAVNMGAEVNSASNEICASVSGDGKYLFFFSRRNGNGDIYWVDAGFIEELRPEK